jgi:hypothetical protein
MMGDSVGCWQVQFYTDGDGHWVEGTKDYGRDNAITYD